MKLYYRLPVALMGVAAIAIVQPQLVKALTPEQLNTVKSLTVLINQDNQAVGSGVILAKSENTYYVLTAEHVLNSTTSKYEIVTTDKISYPISSDKAIRMPELDLAILQFTSSKPEGYKTAELGDSRQLNITSNIYVSGFPGEQSTDAKTAYTLTPGQITSMESVNGIPSLRYSNPTQRGMSGGPLFNENGKVVGIHLGTDAERREGGLILKQGFNRGRPINTFVEMIPRYCSAQGKEKLRQLDYVGAIADFSLGLHFGKSADVYVGRGYAYFALKQYDKALADAKEAIFVNQQSAFAYLLQGASLAQDNKHGEAIRNFDRAISIDSKLVDAYGLRGISYARAGNTKGALADANQVVNMAPNNASSYRYSSTIRSLIGDSQAAQQDIQKASEFTSENSEPYQVVLRANLPTIDTTIVRLPRQNTTQPRDRQEVGERSPRNTNNSSTRNNNITNTNRNNITNTNRTDTNTEESNTIATGSRSNWAIANTYNAEAKIRHVALSPDGRLLAIAIEGGRIQLREFSTGRSIRTLPGLLGGIRAIAFSPDGKTLSAGGLDQIKILDVEGRIPAREISLPRGVSVESVAFSRSGQTVATGMTNGTINIWQVATGRPWNNNFPRHSKAVTALVYSPSSDGMTVASGSEDGTIKVWSLRPGEIGRELATFTEHTGLIQALAFSPNGETLVSSSVDRSIKIWDLKARTSRTLPVGAGVSIYDVAISPDSTTLASANNERIRLWNLSNGQPLDTLIGHTGLVRFLTFTRDGRLVSGSEDKTVIIWQRR